MGSWPVEDALWKSLESCVSSVASGVFPLDVADWAAVCRLVAIWLVTCEYCAGFDCWSCCRLLRICAKGEIWLESCAGEAVAEVLEAVLFEVPVSRDER